LAIRKRLLEDVVYQKWVRNSPKMGEGSRRIEKQILHFGLSNAENDDLLAAHTIVRVLSLLLVVALTLPCRQSPVLGIMLNDRLNT
jgi:hypothetical protein